MKKLAAAVSAFLVFCAACATKPEGARYPLVGTILAVSDGQLTIAHQQIPNFMPAMTMSYKVVGAPPGLHPGDIVKATLVVDKDTEWLEDPGITKKADAGFSPIFSTMSAAPAAAVLGSAVPDFLLRDQDGQSLHLAQFEGEVLMLTFIYTRCPFPDFCPLMMKNLNEVRKAIEAKPAVADKVHFLSVSLDPDYDTPQVLRAYGLRFIPGQNPFVNWTLATALPSQVRDMATWFGVSYSKDGQQINHTLSTAIIGPDGKLISLMADNGWRPADAASIVMHAALTH